MDDEQQRAEVLEPPDGFTIDHEPGVAAHPVAAGIEAARERSERGELVEPDPMAAYMDAYERWAALPADQRGDEPLPPGRTAPERDDFDPSKPHPVPAGIPAQFTAGDGEVIMAEVVVGGVPRDLLAAPPGCRHLGFKQLVEVANLVDDSGEHVAWRAQLKIRCGECGVPFRFTRRSEGGVFVGPDAALSPDGFTLGAMIEPDDEHREGADWPALGAGQVLEQQAPPVTLRIGSGS